MPQVWHELLQPALNSAKLLRRLIVSYSQTKQSVASGTTLSFIFVSTLVRV
eukprot:SAG11_NODE_31785_length_289_cov_0.805263_1_plen_50_part_01